jgi:hypothetical protein
MILGIESNPNFMGGERVEFLKILLWFLIIAALVAPKKDWSNDDKWRFTVEFSVIVMCLTWLYK